MKISKIKTNVTHAAPLTYKADLGADDFSVNFLVDKVKNDKQHSIRNIGIVGPYGSGKSSIAHSFINLLDAKNEGVLYFSQETIGQHLRKQDKIITRTFEEAGLVEYRATVRKEQIRLK